MIQVTALNLLNKRFNVKISQNRATSARELEDDDYPQTA